MARRVLVLTNEDLADANEVPQSIRPLVDEVEEVYVDSKGHVVEREEA